MKHGTMKTLGVAALGAAFAATAAPTASAVGVAGQLEDASEQVLSAPPLRNAVDGGNSIGTMPNDPSDVVSPGTLEKAQKVSEQGAEGVMGDAAAPGVSDGRPGEAAEAGDAGQQGLLGGLPLLGKLVGDKLPTDGLTGGGLPTDALTGGGLPTDGLTGGGLPTDGLTGGLLPGGGLPVG